MSLRGLLWVLCGAALPAVQGCSVARTEPARAPAEKAFFQDLRPASGIDFRTGHAGQGLTILDTVGHGAGLCDFDEDGNLDLVLLGDHRVGVYQGNGRFHFREVTAASGIGQKGKWHGLATGDYDDDGRIDLFLSGYGCSALYRNLGGLRFRNTTAAAGVGVGPPEPDGVEEWRTGAAFLDLERDGRLDLYVLRYARFGPKTPQLCPMGARGEVKTACDPLTYDSQRGVFYRNTGGGKFRDETKVKGFDAAGGHGLGIALADYDDDGWLDIAGANDEHPGDLFHNVRGRVEQVGTQSGTAFDAYGHVHAGMGIDWCDYDRDGRLDLFVTTFQNEEKNLYRNLDGKAFTDMSLRARISEPLHLWVSWGARFLDYDNDGWPDLLVASGHVQDRAREINPQTDYPQPLILLRSLLGQTFEDVSGKAGPALEGRLVGRAVCTGDIDNDGGVDAVVTNAEGQPLILRNVTPDRGHWLRIRLEGPPTNRQAIGARIELKTNAGKRVHDVSTTGSIFAANDVRAHFGLGEERPLGVRVRWPDGKWQLFPAPEIDREAILRHDPKAAD